MVIYKDQLQAIISILPQGVSGEERRWSSGRNLDYGSTPRRDNKRRTWIDLSKNPRVSLPSLVPLSKAPYSPNICSPSACTRLLTALCVLHQMESLVEVACAEPRSLKTTCLQMKMQ
ncbi:unnamed protein product [Pleuronectes platessa]|uniref:Uncharacterized protein n=1 Tax=Pleuronectes platessa TaxID=8262 RepID=A0A9N7YQ62_PLEPL|nr:unnamed protein product [Pleuronectes platessa]